MKSFCASLILFAILLSGIVLNAIYIKKEADILINDLENLRDYTSPDFNKKLESIENKWRRFRIFAELSSPNTELEKIELTIKEMKVYAAKKSAADYAAANKRLIFLLSELTRLEKISFSGLI